MRGVMVVRWMRGVGSDVVTMTVLGSRVSEGIVFAGFRVGVVVFVRAKRFEEMMVFMVILGSVGCGR